MKLNLMLCHADDHDFDEYSDDDDGVDGVGDDGMVVMMMMMMVINIMLIIDALRYKCSVGMEQQQL